MLGRSRNKMLMRFLLSYLFVLCLILTLSLVLSYVASTTIKRYAMDANTLLLDQAKDVIEESFYGTSLLIFQLACSQNLKDFIYSTRDDDNQFRTILDVQTDLAYLLKANQFISDLFIYSTHNNMVVSASSYHDLQSFFATRLNHRSVYYSQWVQDILPGSHFGRYLPAACVKILDQEDEYVAVVWSLPIGLTGQYDGAFVILIEAVKLTRLLSRINLEHGGIVAIRDDKGSVMVSVSSWTREFDPTGYDLLRLTGKERNLIFSQVYSPKTSWTYVSALPRSSILLPVRKFQRFSFSLLGAMFLVGLIVSFFMAKANYSPIGKVIRLLNDFVGTEKSTNEDGYSLLYDSVSHLIDINRRLDLTVNEYLPLLRHSFFDHLLKHGFDSREEFKRYLSKIDMQTDGKLFVVLLVHQLASPYIDGDDGAKSTDYATGRRKILNHVTAQFSNIVWVHPCDMTTQAIISSWPDGNENAFRHFVTQRYATLCTALCEERNRAYRISVGGIYAHLADLRMSYQEALKTMSVLNLTNKHSILWYDDVPRDSIAHPYSIAFEQRLINQIMIGNRVEVERMMRRFYEVNISQSRLSYPMLQILKHEMTGTIIRVIQEAGLQDQLNQAMSAIPQDTGSDQFFSRVIDLCLDICDTIADDKKSSDAHFKTRLLDLIHEHYHNIQLTIDMLSDMVGVRTGFLQRYFRNSIGLSFAKYLENLRMENAQQLLENTELPVHEISSGVGYASDKSFRRAFKRITGSSPATYREQLRVTAAIDHT